MAYCCYGPCNDDLDCDGDYNDCCQGVCIDSTCPGNCTWDGTGGGEWDLIVPCSPLDPVTGAGTGCCYCEPPAPLFDNLDVQRTMPCLRNNDIQ